MEFSLKGLLLVLSGGGISPSGPWYNKNLNAAEKGNLFLNGFLCSAGKQFVFAYCIVRVPLDVSAMSWWYVVLIHHTFTKPRAPFVVAVLVPVRVKQSKFIPGWSRFFVAILLPDANLSFYIGLNTRHVSVCFFRKSEKVLSWLRRARKERTR